MAVIYDHDKLRNKVTRALADDFKHNAIEHAQNTIGGNRIKLVSQMPEWENFRAEAGEIRQHVLDNLDYYVREFATNAAAAGAHMHFAPTADDALDAILDVFEEVGADSCVKSKSMMTEEIGLNEFLEERGISPIETDLAESIIQTAGDKPSHIVVPALHFDRKRIRDLYRDKRGYTGTEHPEEITHFVRGMLRHDFMNAKVGVTGCNFGVAETGSCTLVSNEGNARMASSIPETQIVVMGIERIVPDLRSLDIMMKLLVPSAVGAKITSSFSINTGNARPGEADGPKNLHIVMINNGRSNILGSDFRPMLRCIRCGACMNSCPVYRHITGHGYGSIYPGPMGIVLTPLLVGYEEAEKLPYACSMCGRCDEVCPVQIPLSDMIFEHRQNMVAQGYTSPTENAAFTAYQKFLQHRSLYDAATSSGSPAMKLISDKTLGRVSQATSWVPLLGNWTGSRDLDVLSKTKFREQFSRAAIADPKLRVESKNGKTPAVDHAVARIKREKVEKIRQEDREARADRLAQHRAQRAARRSAEAKAQRAAEEAEGILNNVSYSHAADATDAQSSQHVSDTSSDVAQKAQYYTYDAPSASTGDEQENAR